MTLHDQAKADGAPVRWRTRPVFVSSTFNDFQAERDVLQSLVFPELADRLRTRRHYLEPIDLRLGVETVSEEDEAQKTLLVLTVCLNEVARSRPFVIALVGDRYGWVPPVDRARRAAEEAGIPDDGRPGRSITDLELEFGVLQQPDDEPARAFAYFRELDLREAADDARRRYIDADALPVEDLKQRLLARLGPERCRTYHATFDPVLGAVAGLEEFRRLVVEDLWSDLDEQTRNYQVITETWQDAERAALDAFVNDSTREFTGREPLLGELLALARSGPEVDSPSAGNADSIQQRSASSQAFAICVAGPSGSGKSSLAAELIRRLGEDASILLLHHAAGISTASARVDRLLERWCEELAAHVGEADLRIGEMNGEELERAFARLLTRASGTGRVVLILDALNEFERTTRARHLTWLPRLWPENARLIATAIPGPESEAIAKRGARLVNLEPLTADEADRIVGAIYRRYRRKANPDVKRALLSRRTNDGSPASGSPLWLELACEEMNLLEPDDLARANDYPGAPDHQIVLLQMDLAHQLPATPLGLYGSMLRRAETIAASILNEQRHHVTPHAARSWVRCLSECIAISREGWREQDLQTVLAQVTGLPWSDLLFASIRRAYRGHLIQRGTSGQWNFYHQELRQAVAEHFGASVAELRALHATLAAYLQTLQGDEPLRQAELMHHLIGADDRYGAARFYGESEPGSAQLRAQTESLADLFRVREDAAEWVAGLISLPLLSLQERLLLGEKLLTQLNWALANTGHTQERRRIMTAVREEMYRLTQTTVSRVWADAAVRFYGTSLVQLADLAIDTGDREQARLLYEQYLSIAERRAIASPGLALPEEDLAEEWSIAARQDLAVALERLGELAEQEGDVSTAREYLGRHLSVSRELIAADPASRRSAAYLATGLVRLGLLSLSSGNIAEAERYLTEAAQWYERVAQLPGEEFPTEDDPKAAALQALARLAEAKDDMKTARRLYGQLERLRRTRAEAAPEDVHAQVAWLSSLDQLGNVALFQGDRAEALRVYDLALEAAGRLAAQIPDEVATLSDLSSALMKRGDIHLHADEPHHARPFYERMLETQTRLHDLVPDETRNYRQLGLAHERLGMLEDGSREEQLRHLQEAVLIYTDLFERFPDSEEAARTVALGHFAIARALAGDRQRAIEMHRHARHAHEILSDARARGQRLAPEARRLLSTLDTQFGGSGRWTHPVAEEDEAAYAELNGLGMQGNQALAVGDYESAARHVAQSLELARQINHPPSIARAYGILGDVEARRGNLDEAFRLYEEAISVAHANGLPVEEGITISRVADLHADLGHKDAAMEAYKKQVELAQAADNQRGLALGLANIGLLLLENDEPTEAALRLSSAAELFDSYRMWPDLIKTYSHLVTAYLAVRDYQGAIDAYTRQIEASRKNGDALSAATAMANLSQLLFLLGDRSHAIALGTQASDLLSRLGSPHADEFRAAVAAWQDA